MSERPHPPGVDAIVVNWNGRRFLPSCLDALADSTVPVRITVVDNDSEDGSADYIRSAYPNVHLLPLDANRGYAGGANAGLGATSNPLAMILNPDVVLAPDHLEILADRLSADATIGAAQGKLYRVSEEDLLAGRRPMKLLDSAGHVIRRTRMVFDRGQGQPDGPCWNSEASVFSATGAALLLRRSAVRDIAPNGIPFDPAFFSYKEDIDLCWRARLLGWDVRYVPDAEGWHARAVPGPGSRGRGASARARRHSWVNHWLMMLKNDRPGDVVRHSPWILGWELVRIGHALVRDPALLPAYAQVWPRIRGAWRSRKSIQQRCRVPATQIRHWFSVDALPPGKGAPARPGARSTAGRDEAPPG